MDSNVYDRLTEQVRCSLPDGPVVVVIGSSSLRHPQSERTCRAIGRGLADIPDLALVTGGVTGAGEAVGRSFSARRLERERMPCVFHLLPPQYPQWEYGQNLVVGETMIDRREILARIASIYICVEGGPGTEHEAGAALGQGSVVIPVGRSGGFSAALYARLERPAFGEADSWATLGAESAQPESVAAAVCSLLAAALRIGC